MGICVSAHRDSESAMKVQLSFGSKADKLVVPSSPTKDNKPIIDAEAAGLKPQWPATSFRDFGSKEESFFDSQAWIESDSEDDFMSVKGDFTPSCGTTPVHHNFSAGKPPVNGALSVDQTPVSLSEPSLTEKKTRLSDLFNDSLPRDPDFEEENTMDNQNGTSGKIEPKSATGSPYVPGASMVHSSELTSNGNSKLNSGRVKSVQCCFPSMLSSCSFSEKKKKMSPAHTIG